MPDPTLRTDDAPTPAVLYAAKSTKDPRRSIPRQIEDCKVMADREGWEVVGEFQDEGFSAYSGNRGPGLERAKAFAARAATEHGECILVAQHSDRISRGAGDAPDAADHLVEVVAWLTRHGVTLRTVQDDFYGDPRIAHLMAAAMGQRNTEDSGRKSKAVASGKRGRARDRKLSNGPLAFGYRLVPRKDGEGKDRVLDPANAPVVRRMFEMLDGGESVGSITRWLNNQGIRTTRGNAFGRQRVREILRNPYYGGKFRHGDEVLDGDHEALLPWEEFERISGKLGGHLRPAADRGGRPPIRYALLSGVMRCAHCGHGVWHRKVGGARTYCCGAVRHATGACTEAVPFDAALVEEAVVKHLDSLFVDLGSWIERLTEQRAGQRDAVVRELTLLNDQRSQLAKGAERMRDRYRKQVLAGNDGEAGIAASEVQRIEAEREELDREAADLDSRLAEWDGDRPADEVLDWWSEFSDAVRGGIVDAPTVQEANRAMRDRFAAVFVRSPEGGTPRLDFILKDKPPGAPLVTSHLWADTEEDHARAQEEGSFLVDFVGEDPGTDAEIPVGRNWCASNRFSRRSPHS